MICVMPPLFAGSATLICEPGATTRYSCPRTSTARPFGPVAITSPAWSAAPRLATRINPLEATVTGPEASDSVQPGVPASALVEHSNPVRIKTDLSVLTSTFPKTRTQAKSS